MVSSTALSIKSILAEEGEIIRAAHFSGAGGSEIVQRRTALIDRTLRTIRSNFPSADAMPSLVAIGGYGRGELNPHSDIDIMFLCRDEADRKLTPDILYVLWDAGLDVGYSVRTIQECISLARTDIKIRTSLLESRLIAGDAVRYRKFTESMASEVYYWRASTFISDKISERAAMRKKYGDSIYLREPNIKDGDGGLRDVHTAFWVAFVHFRVSSLSELVERGVIARDQFAVFQRSWNFLWRLRNEIHYLSGRKNDHLTFDLQEQVSKDFHYRDSEHLLAVERFMKSYFLHARNIRDFSNRVLDAALRKKTARWFERTVSVGPFSVVGRTLVYDKDELCLHEPWRALQAFEIAQERHITFSDRMMKLLRECRIDDAVRTSPDASRTFLAILNNPDNLFETLSLMKSLRVLGKYLPEFRRIQALARHDFYHLYTVDEHILLAIRNLQYLWLGNYPALESLVASFKSLEKRWVLILAVLLHDIGKAYRSDHENKGAELAEGVLIRLGVQEADRDRIQFLIRNHLVMSTLSQRRELTERKVIADFARLVGDRETLLMLYLLTYADIAAVRPAAWTQWKAVLLQDLFLRTLRFLDKNIALADEDRSRLAGIRDRVVTEGRIDPETVDEYISAMSEQYLLYTPAARIADHVRLVQRLKDEFLIITHRHYPEKGYTELTVCAYDAYGMFFRTAGTLASKNLNILRAQVYTSKNGVMIDTFQITDADGKLTDYDAAWESVTSELHTALMMKTRPAEPVIAVSDRSGMVRTTVDFDNDSSEMFTIIDVTAQDRVGLLYQITKTLYDLNLDIGSAKIVTEGARIMDSFYVTDLFHKKIGDEQRLAKIREALIAILPT